MPALQELAEPLMQPGALPDGITLSIGLIASTDPAVLTEASRNVAGDFFDAATEANPAMSAIPEQHYNELRATISEARQKQLDRLAAEATEQQDVLGMIGSLGYAPAAEDLQQLFDLDGQVQELAAASVEDHPRVQAARDDLVDAMASRARASLDLPGLEPFLHLSDDINQDVNRLSRAGWLATTAAGLIIGASAALGLTLTQDTPQAPPTATQYEQAQAETIANEEAKLGIILPIASGLLGGGAGFGIGVRLKGRFARFRARSLVRKAGGTL